MHHYYARDGVVYVAQSGQPDREAGTAITADGRDLERHEAALQIARRQREHKDTFGREVEV